MSVKGDRTTYNRVSSPDLSRVQDSSRDGSFLMLLGPIPSVSLDSNYKEYGSTLQLQDDAEIHLSKGKADYGTAILHAYLNKTNDGRKITDSHSQVLLVTKVLVALTVYLIRADIPLIMAWIPTQLQARDALESILAYSENSARRLGEKESDTFATMLDLLKRLRESRLLDTEI